MSLEIVSIPILSAARTHLGGGDYAEAETQIAGSPFAGRVYRAAQNTVGRDEAAPGVATVDQMPRMSIYDPACPVKVGMIALLPDPQGTTALVPLPGTFTRAKVIRVRGRYGDRVQYDLETGAE